MSILSLLTSAWADPAIQDTLLVAAGAFARHYAPLIFTSLETQTAHNAAANNIVKALEPMIEAKVNALGTAPAAPTAPANTNAQGGFMLLAVLAVVGMVSLFAGLQTGILTTDGRSVAYHADVMKADVAATTAAAKAGTVKATAEMKHLADISQPIYNTNQ